MFPQRLMLCVGDLADFDAIKGETAWLARKLGAALVVYHARFPTWKDVEMLREDRATEEAQAMERLLESPELKGLEVEILCADPPLDLVDQILAEAEEREVDLLLMPTHKRRGLDRLVLGSFTERAIRSCKIPVLALDLEGMQGEEGMEAIDRILVPVDFSDPSKASLPYAFSWAEKFGCPVTVLHVVEEHFLLGAKKGANEPESLIVEQLEEDLGLLVERTAQGFSVDVETRAIPGHVVEEVAKVVGEARRPLVVMATAGRDSLGDYMLGSRAERILRSAPGSILTLPVSFLGNMRARPSLA